MRSNTAINLATGQGDLATLKMLLVDIQSGLTRQVAYEAPKLFQVKKSLGERELLKLLILTLKAFQDSLKVKEGMEAADLIECAEMLLAKYSHDSLKDIMLALKEAKWNGRVFYNSLSGPVVMDILAKYFDSKALELEAEHRRLKAQPAPELLTQLPPAVGEQFKQAIAPPLGAFDEEEYRKQRAAWVAQRMQAAEDANPQTEAAA